MEKKIFGSSNIDLGSRFDLVFHFKMNQRRANKN
jgi:hypothetical protein